MPHPLQQLKFSEAVFSSNRFLATELVTQYGYESKQIEFFNFLIDLQRLSNLEKTNPQWWHQFNEIKNAYFAIDGNNPPSPLNVYDKKIIDSFKVAIENNNQGDIIIELNVIKGHLLSTANQEATKSEQVTLFNKVMSIAPYFDDADLIVSKNINSLENHFKNLKIDKEPPRVDADKKRILLETLFQRALIRKEPIEVLEKILNTLQVFEKHLATEAVSDFYEHVIEMSLRTEKEQRNEVTLKTMEIASKNLSGMSKDLVFHLVKEKLPDDILKVVNKKEAAAILRSLQLAKSVLDVQTYNDFYAKLKPFTESDREKIYPTMTVRKASDELKNLNREVQNVLIEKFNQVYDPNTTANRHKMRPNPYATYYAHGQQSYFTNKEKNEIIAAIPEKLNSKTASTEDYARWINILAQNQLPPRVSQGPTIFNRVSQIAGKVTKVLTGNKRKDGVDEEVKEQSTHRRKI